MLSIHDISMATVPTFKEATDKSSRTKSLTSLYAIFFTSHVPLASLQSCICYLDFSGAQRLKRYVQAFLVKKKKKNTVRMLSPWASGESPGVSV